MATITFEHTGVGGRTSPGSSLLFGLGARAPLGWLPLGAGPTFSSSTAGIRPIRFESDKMRPTVETWFASVGETGAVTIAVKSNGSAVDLTNLASATLKAEDVTTGTVKHNVSFTSSDVSSATGGLIAWAPAAGDMDTAGTYWAQLTITWSDGSVDRYPNNGRVYFEIREATA